jgi:RimJ/RimL family protein N-acetyltransferase
MSGFPGVTSLAKPKSRSGGLERRKAGAAARGAPAVSFATRQEATMGTLHPADHVRHTDRLRLRDGNTLTVRFATPGDAEALQTYFRHLSARSRYNRFLGAVSELPAGLLDHFTRAGENDRFSVVAAMMLDGTETIIWEARYALEVATGDFEFGISLDDRWQRQGIGAVLLGNLECRAAALGTRRMFGDTLRSNTAMIALARKSGFVPAPSPGDWKLVRFEKQVDPEFEEVPCAGWRLVARMRAANAAA